MVLGNMTQPIIVLLTTALNISPWVFSCGLVLVSGNYLMVNSLNTVGKAMYSWEWPSESYFGIQ